MQRHIRDGLLIFIVLTQFAYTQTQDNGYNGIEGIPSNFTESSEQDNLTNLDVEQPSITEKPSQVAVEGEEVDETLWPEVEPIQSTIVEQVDDETVIVENYSVLDENGNIIPRVGTTTEPQPLEMNGEVVVNESETTPPVEITPEEQQTHERLTNVEVVSVEELENRKIVKAEVEVKKKKSWWRKTKDFFKPKLKKAGASLKVGGSKIKDFFKRYGPKAWSGTKKVGSKVKNFFKRNGPKVWDGD